MISTVMVGKEEVKKIMQGVQEVLFDYTPQNAEIFSQELEDIEDKDKLLQIRHKLQDAKAIWNQVRTMGSEQLKTLFQEMKPGDVQNLLKVVNARIDNINLKNMFSHNAEVSGMINMALSTIEFKFRKRGENILEIGSDIREQMAKKQKALSQELTDNIDQDDDEYISLLEEIQQFFADHGFEPASLAEAKEDIKFMDQAMERIKEINRRNANLQAKYRGDSKYVKAHKRIRRFEKRTNTVLLSEKEVEQCHALNMMKDVIDEMLTNRKEMITNEPEFYSQLISAIAQTLQSIKVKAKHKDREYIAGILSDVYLKEFNGWR